MFAPARQHYLPENWLAASEKHYLKLIGKLFARKGDTVTHSEANLANNESRVHTLKERRETERKKIESACMLSCDVERSGKLDA